MFFRRVHIDVNLASKRLKHTLVLVRHGESLWNLENKFTGWYDCPLTENGHKEAITAGLLLKKEGYSFDIAYTSYLKRAIRTLWHFLEETDQMFIPYVQAWQLNERLYGALEGLEKKETVDKYGKAQVDIWRRSYDACPPPVSIDSPYYPGKYPRYANLSYAHLKTESLKLAVDNRIVPYYENVIIPQIQAGKKVLVVAHGNSLRGLLKHIDNISDSGVSELNIPTAAPLVYELDANMKPIPHSDAIAPLKCRYLGNQDAIKARIFGVKDELNISSFRHTYPDLAQTVRNGF